MGVKSVASVAGYITAAARAKLLVAMQALLKDGHKVFMCDTDSVVTNGTLPEHLVGKALGQWELEETSPGSDCEFLAPKFYTFQGETKCKGIREPVQGNNIYTQAQFSKWSTDLLSTNSERNERLEHGALVTQITKTVTGENRKRVDAGLNKFNNPIVLDQF